MMTSSSRYSIIEVRKGIVKQVYLNKTSFKCFRYHSHVMSYDLTIDRGLSVHLTIFSTPNHVYSETRFKYMIIKKEPHDYKYIYIPLTKISHT